MEYKATISSKGQITLPADIRRSLNVKPGDRLRLTNRSGNVFISADSYDQELADLRSTIEQKLKANGTWGTPFHRARAAAESLKIDEYRKRSLS